MSTPVLLTDLMQLRLLTHLMHLRPSCVSGGGGSQRTCEWSHGLGTICRPATHSSGVSRPAVRRHCSACLALCCQLVTLIVTGCHACSSTWPFTVSYTARTPRSMAQVSCLQQVHCQAPSAQRQAPLARRRLNNIISNITCCFASLQDVKAHARTVPCLTA